jgi:hypothetical protein
VRDAATLRLGGESYTGPTERGGCATEHPVGRSTRERNGGRATWAFSYDIAYSDEQRQKILPQGEPCENPAVIARRPRSIFTDWTSRTVATKAGALEAWAAATARDGSTLSRPGKHLVPRPRRAFR